MPRFLTAALLGVSLVGTMAIAPTTVLANDRVYHDADHNDDHHWDDREDHAYRAWVKETHRKYHDFAKLKVEEQRQYWAWRHDHPDAH